MDKRQRAIENFFKDDYLPLFQRYLSGEVKNDSDEMMAQCPFHSDNNPSFFVNVRKGLFYCHGCRASGNKFDFYARVHEMTLPRDFSKVLDGIARDFSIDTGNGHKQATKPTVTTRYDYQDESGNLVYQVERFNPKSFRIRRPDGKGGWIYDAKGVKIVPYHLPEVLQTADVLVVEGEKDCDNLIALGFAATTNPFGAGKFPPDFGQYFTGKHITLIPDNDEPGRQHMHSIAAILKNHAASIKRLDLPDLLSRGDVSDWLAKYQDQNDAAERLAILIENAAEYKEESTVMENIDPWAKYTFTLKDAYAPREPLKYIVEGLFSLPSLSIVYGAPGTLKSLFMGFVAVSVAAGLPCLGRETIKAAVLWIDFDNGKRRSHERFEALGRGTDIPETVPFFYASMPHPWLNAGNSEDIESLCSRIIEQEIKLVIIDNLGLVSPGADENSGEMIYIMSNLRELSERTSAAVVLIHHQRKTNGRGRIGESLRGHSSIEGALDVALLISREEDSNVVTIRSTKTRDVDVTPFATEFWFEHRLGTDELAKAGFKLLEMEDTTSDRAIEKIILNTVFSNPSFKQKQVIETVKPKLRAGVNRIRSVYNRLKETGKLDVD